MPRSPNDATRFTATQPYMASKPSEAAAAASNPSTVSPAASSRSQIDFGTAPPNESAQQKIARLRAAASSARRGKETGFDKAVRVGRVWADRAHRVTAIGLIGLTVVAGVVATAGITDMLMHNRRRRNEWLAEKQAQSAAELLEARKAQSKGIVTEDQMLLINRERAKEAAEEEKRNRPGMFKRAGSYLFGGLSQEEQKGGKLGAAVSQAEEKVFGKESQEGVLGQVKEQVESRRRAGERVEGIVKPFGGPLDRQAEAAVTAAVDKSKSWTSWAFGQR